MYKQCNSRGENDAEKKKKNRKSMKSHRLHGFISSMLRSYVNINNAILVRLHANWKILEKLIFYVSLMRKLERIAKTELIQCSNDTQ